MLDLLEHDILFSINIKIQTNDVVFLLKTTDNDEFPGDKQFLSFIVYLRCLKRKLMFFKIGPSVSPTVCHCSPLLVSQTPHYLTEDVHIHGVKR